LVSARISVKNNLDDDQKQWAETEMLGTTRRAKNTSYGPSMNRVFSHLSFYNAPPTDEYHFH